MVTRKQFSEKFPAVTEGLNVFTQDGEKLGKVIELEDDYLTVEKGFFFPKDFTFRYDDVVDVRDDELFINRNRSELSHWQDVNYRGWNEAEKANEMKVPVAEEELEAHKVVHQKGEVRIRKIVHTEMKSFTVPVTSEEVIVERRSIPVGREPQPGESDFKDSELTIPIMEEEVEIRKHPRIKEEVRIHKESRTEEKNVSGEVKKEDVRVEGENEKKRKAA